jgi:hypothetical protein
MYIYIYIHMHTSVIFNVNDFYKRCTHMCSQTPYYTQTHTHTHTYIYTHTHISTDCWVRTFEYPLINRDTSSNEISYALMWKMYILPYKICIFFHIKYVYSSSNEISYVLIWNMYVLPCKICIFFQQRNIICTDMKYVYQVKYVYWKVKYICYSIEFCLGSCCKTHVWLYGLT